MPRYRIADPSFREKFLGPELGDKPSVVREKVAPISLRTKGREVRRESEGVVVLESKDNKTLLSPGNGAREGPLLGLVLRSRRYA